MSLTENAKKYHERMFPGYESVAIKKDPEFIERFDNFAYDEVVNQPGQELPDKTRWMAILSTQIGSQAVTPYSALASGRLSRKPGENDTKRAAEDAYAKFKYDATADQDNVIISRVAELSEKRGVTMTELCPVFGINGSFRKDGHTIQHKPGIRAEQLSEGFSGTGKDSGTDWRI